MLGRHLKHETLGVQDARARLRGELPGISARSLPTDLGHADICGASTHHLSRWILGTRVDMYHEDTKSRTHLYHLRSDLLSARAG